ncbi:MAG: CDP-alcohol phosphatidyltransferase family protein [Gemmatimonadota bacterium]|nr:CDP-alcohol phosphatidyltransferase family protein [Gemmatimonadota bacterium]
MNLPNLITISRIILSVLIVPLLFVDQFGVRLFAFIVFLIAAISDLWDGHIARSRGLITDLGKLLDPIADKILLFATVFSFYLLSRGYGPGDSFPWFGNVLPLWILIVLFGRELFITLFRGYARRRGVVIAAGPAGKYKAVFQNIFIGAGIFWLALWSAARDRGWNGEFWAGWQRFHFTFAVVTLSIAVFMTVYSMFVYLWGYRSVMLTSSSDQRH